MRTKIPTTNPLAVLVAGSGQIRGGKILNTGAGNLYVSDNLTTLAASIDPNTGVPSQGWPLAPNAQLEWDRFTGITYYAVAAAAGGEAEVLQFDADLGCCP